ncbi:P-loop NTPase fold protein [Saccharothrix sp. HUAS TT1]|uniref:P-loop NTPase fold protein n=1 Tax=unclassified Saccharothrix TaxID=2593673 RepID=UPI00345B7841
MARTIFISYASPSRDAVLVLDAWLRDRGVITRWWRGTSYPDEWSSDEAEDAISTADAFIVMMSPDYTVEDRCRRELGFAEDHAAREDSFKIVVLVPEGTSRRPSFIRYPHVRYTEPFTSGSVPDVLGALDDEARPGLEPRPAPFVGRAEDFRELERWCESTDRHSGAMIFGAPGSGRTRLARELCARMAVEGWNAGFSTDPGLLPSSAARTLVVVDHAGIAPVGRVVEALGASPGGRTRLLLLADDAEPDALWTEVTRAAPGRFGERPRATLSLDQRLMRPAELKALVDGVVLPAVVLDHTRNPLDHLVAASLVGAEPQVRLVADVRTWRSAYADFVVRSWMRRLNHVPGERDGAARALLVATLVGVPPSGLGALAADLGFPRLVPDELPDRWDVLPAPDGTTLLAHEAVLAASVASDPRVLDDAFHWVRTHPDHLAGFLRRLAAATLADRGLRPLVAPRLADLVEQWPLGRDADRTGMDDALLMCVEAVAAEVGPSVAERWRAAVDRDADTGSALDFVGTGDQRARVDALDRGPWIDVLVDLLAPSPAAAALDRDATGPSVIAVDGPWGAGKTSLMGMVRDRLDALPGPERPTGRARVRDWCRNRRLTVAGAVFLLGRKADPEPDVPSGRAPTTPVTVWFNPWAHQSSDQVWAGLARAILGAVGPRLHPGANARARYWLRRNGSRLDRSPLRRSLVRSTRSPVLRIAFAALCVPIAAVLLRLDRPFSVFGLVEVTSGARVAGWFAVALVAYAVLDTLSRFLFGRAANHAPAGLLDGPVLSGTLARPGADVTLRDPLYHARSGYLYLLQHDIRRLLVDAADSGLAVVVFVDDLDRCGAKVAGEVLEAINLFLSEAFPATKFVIGLDMGVVAAQVDRAMEDFTAERARRHSDDPSPGWTFLRKLVQLPVLLPRIERSTMDGLVSRFLGPVDAADVPVVRPASAQPAAVPSMAVAAPTTDPTPDAVVPAPGQGEGVAPDREPTDVAKLERHPRVRQCLRRRLDALPELSAREAKRLLTVWQFYVRVLARAGAPVVGADEVRQAGAVVLLAEIVVRWPALLPDLFGFVEGEQGLARLCAAARDDDVAWARATAKAGLDRVRDAAAAKSLRELLLEDDAHLLVALARRLF